MSDLDRRLQTQMSASLPRHRGKQGQAQQELQKQMMPLQPSTQEKNGL